jgi:alpha-glucosidase
MFSTLKRVSLILITLCVVAVSFSTTVLSPNGKIAASVDLKELLEPHPAGERLYYSVSLNGAPLILDSPFRIDFKGQPAIAKDLSITDQSQRTVNETWKTVLGKSSSVVNSCNELALTLREKNAPNRTFTFTVRAFDDGVAFQYGFPQSSGIEAFKISNEFSEFHFPGDPLVWAVNYGGFQTHQEGEFNKRKLSECKAGETIGCPLLVQLPNGWIALTEANLVDWAGLYFARKVEAPNAVVSVLSPRLDEPDVAVISQAPRVSPWRVIMIGEKPGDLIESNIILNLADPCELTDTSWIKPGVSAWDRWWPGSYAPDFNGVMGVNNPSMKYFIDLAAEMGWEYQLVDWEWYGPPFDPAKPSGAAGNPAADLTKSIDVINIPELVDYAGKKGVKILVWLDWDNANRQMAKAFPLYEKWGVAGVKVDFMARDDQEMVNFYHRLVKLAAKHHLTVDFHGAYKPDGFRRTYPNLLTREGVLGNEYNKWSDRVTPTHNVTLPFTRMLCGPMDYTPGGFRNKTPQTFRIVGGDAPGPFVQTTRAQQLAMPVVYESPLLVMCDSPYNYHASPAGLDFLKIVPTTWDETKVLDGYPGDFIVIARRSGKTWFVGGMTNEQERAVSVPIDFLGTGKFTAKIWTDAEEAAEYPDRVTVSEKAVTATDKLEVKMAGSGGAVMVISPVK